VIWIGATILHVTPRGSGTLDAGLALAAQRVVERTLGVVAAERVIVAHDAAHDEVAEAIAAAVRVAKSEPVLFQLEALGPRPHARLDERIAAAIPSAQASLLAIEFHAGELKMRTAVVDLAARSGLRHGHMIGITRSTLVAGFSVDPVRIAEKGRDVLVRMRKDSRIFVKSAAGTDLTIQLAPWCRWMEFGATVSAGKRVNLPGGELVTSPESVSGTYVADGTLGDADGKLRRRLRATPVTLKIASSRVQSVECANDRGLARELDVRFKATASLDRVGLVGFGLNLGLTDPTGEVFADQKMPGVHLSFGETFPTQTGASWTSSSWLALTLATCDVEIDRVPVLRAGRFLV
jgi:leucyl aminopeptidase (aminopeptidase T)